MDSVKVSDKKFFSYATVATMGEPAYSAVRTFLDDFYSIGPPEVLYTYDPLVDKLSAEAAQLINANADEITYIKNTTEGLNIASNALPLRPGDEILVQAAEYPANLLPWLKKRQDGITVTVVKAANNIAAFQRLLESISSKTKIITISSAQWYDGYMADIAALSAICQQQNIFLVLDAVQTIGIRKIDVRQTPVAMLISGGQKYLQAGVGTGFIYVNRKVMDSLHDTKIGIRSMEHFTEDAYTLKPTAARFQDGTQNLYGIVALHAALKHINHIGIDKLEQQNRAVLMTVRACLREFDIPFIDHGDNQGNIVSMPVPNPVGLFEHLKQHAVYIKAVKDVARISFVAETQREDIQTLAALTRSWLDR